MAFVCCKGRSEGCILMSGRRLQFARLLMAMGVHELFARRASASLLIFNYHRIWPSREVRRTCYDDGVFDTDVDSFRSQMLWLKASTTILDEEALLELNSRAGSGTGDFYSAVTFDDGYIDCFRLVKPVLDELGIRGMFFVPFEMLESRRLGWWDIAAYLLKGSRHPSIHVSGQIFELGPELPRSIQRILTMFKVEPSAGTEGLLDRLSEACGVPIPSKDEQSSQLMNWNQVRELQTAGHAIGSHSLSHRVLSSLTPENQREEIIDSRRKLQAVTGTSICSFAYPVGGPQHINDYSIRFARDAGYHQAFTFNTGISSVPIKDPFRIPRESAKSLALLKAKVMLPGLMGLEKSRAV